MNDDRAPKPTLIEIEDVWTQFGEKVVHKELNLDVFEGEVLALVGGSGSGKTTLLRHMIGLSEPSRGTVTVLGTRFDSRDFMKQRYLKRQMGVLFQFGALFSSLSVAENIALPLEERGGLSRQDKMDLVMLRLQQVGLQAQDAFKMPAELSGGMVKRVALARALALDPRLLFLDEPTSGLDPVAAQNFVELILSLKELMNLTAVMVTHDLARMRRLTDRVAVLADQTIVAVGSIEDVAQVRHPFIEEYFGMEFKGSTQSAEEEKSDHGK